MNDKKIISRQLSQAPQGLVGVPLGRTPQGLTDIAHRCRFGYPTVIMAKPLVRRGEKFDLFPTLYWLSCPRRVEAVTKIEAEGYTSKLEKELNSDDALKEEYESEMENYTRQQEELLLEDDRRFIETHGLEEALSGGIGVRGDLGRLKCLHLHLAHHLAEENVIGEILIRRFQLDDCSSEDVICDGLAKEG